VTELSENLVRKLEETVAQNQRLDRGLNSEMRGLLRDLRSVLFYTEFELKETQEVEGVIKPLKEAVQLVKYEIFFGVLEGGEQEDQQLFGKISDLINDGYVGQIYEALNLLNSTAHNYLTRTVVTRTVAPTCGVCGPNTDCVVRPDARPVCMCQYNYIGQPTPSYSKGCRPLLKSRSGDRTELSGLARTTIAKSERIVRKLKELVAGNRELDSGMRSLLRDMRSLLRFSEEKVQETRDSLEFLRFHFNNPLLWSFVNDSGQRLIQKEVELIIIWKDALNNVKQDVFYEKDDQDLFEEVEAIIEYEDWEDFYDGFKYLKESAEDYL